MKRTAIILTIAAAALAAGCGSGSTRTVSVSSGTPTDTSSTSAKLPPVTAHKPSAQSTPSAASTPATTSTPSSPSGGTAAPGSGSASHGPAFLSQGAGAQGLNGAVAVLQSRGYSALDTGQYRSDQTLKVLVGARQGSADNHVQQAFFFVNGHYLGTDTTNPSAQIRVVGQNDTEVTLAYSLYRSKDPLCCPSGGQAQVRYQLDNGRLTPLDPIPGTTASAAAAGRQ